MQNGIEKVILDTNTLKCDNSAEYFLGGRDELEKFKNVAEIYIPEMVIEEIRAQKKQHLLSKKTSFLENIFHKIRGIDVDETENFDIDTFILKQEQEENIPYKTISLTDFSILPKMQQLALAHLPPFDEKTDKGFKDAIIYFSILEFLNSAPEDCVYLVTKDARLKEAFVEEKRVRVVSNFEEFQHYRTSYFKEEYFIKKLREEVDGDIKSEHIHDVWMNINSNWVILIDTGVAVYHVEIDFSTREIMGFTSEDFSQAVQELCISGNFRTTHAAVETLEEFKQYLSDIDISRLMAAANVNDQIYWLAGDDDVKEFFLLLYKEKAHILLDDVREIFEERFHILKTAI